MEYLSHSLSLRERPRSTVSAVIVHTTGRGLTNVGLRSGAFGTEEFDQACVNWYSTSGTQYYGHDIIGSTGKVYRLAHWDRVCLHTASLNQRYEKTDWMLHAINPKTLKLVKHGRQPHVVYDWWIARWGSGFNPRSFVGSLHVNQRTVAVDLIPDSHGDYSDAQYAALNRLLAEYKVYFRGIRHVIGHADVDPMRRGIVLSSTGVLIGKDWDPGAGFDWGRVDRG